MFEKTEFDRNILSQTGERNRKWNTKCTIVDELKWKFNISRREFLLKHLKRIEKTLYIYVRLRMKQLSVPLTNQPNIEI